jgi:hypothetical protein
MLKLQLEIQHSSVMTFDQIFNLERIAASLSKYILGEVANVGNYDGGLIKTLLRCSLLDMLLPGLIKVLSQLYFSHTFDSSEVVVCDKQQTRPCFRGFT